MAKVSVKVKQVGAKKPKTQLLVRKQQGQSAQQKRATLLQQRWGAELTALQSQEFASIEAAVEAIIDSVVTRIASSAPSEQAKARDFLRVLFESDPHLLAELRTLLQINS